MQKRTVFITFFCHRNAYAIFTIDIPAIKSCTGTTPYININLEYHMYSSCLIFSNVKWFNRTKLCGNIIASIVILVAYILIQFIPL